MEDVFMCEVSDLNTSRYESPFIIENNVDEERNPLMELFPDTLAMSLNTLEHVDEVDYYPDPKFQLFGGLVLMECDVGFYAQPEIIQLESDTDNLAPKPEPKKRGRPRKIKASPVPAEPIRKSVPSVSVELTTLERKKKKRKCMTQDEKAQHNHLERERRKGMTSLLEGLREKVPAVKDDKKASQKKIVDEATVYLKEQKPHFLEYLKERRRFLSLEKRRRELEDELSSKRKGVLCVSEERRGMSTGDIYKRVKKEALEDIRDEETDEAIRVLESYRYRSPESSPSYSDSSSPSSLADSDDEDDDDDDDEHINVEV